MQEQSKTNLWNAWNASIDTWGISLPNNVTQILDRTHSWVGDIVDIRALEKDETNLAIVFWRALQNQVCNLLWINNIKPEVYAQITETLRRSRCTIQEVSKDSPKKDSDNLAKAA